MGRRSRAARPVEGAAENRPAERPPLGRVSATLWGIALLLLGWSGLSLLVGSRLVPQPLEVARVFMRLFASGDLALHASATLARLLAGLAAAAALAVPLGVAVGVVPILDRLLSPVLYVLYPIPKIAFLPVFMVLFGLGNTAKIILLVTVIIFQLAIATRDSVRRVPQELIFAATTLQLTTAERFRLIYLPGTLPSLFSALRISVGIGVAVLFLAENYATRYGLGYFIMNTWSMVTYDRMFAGIVALALLAVIVLKAIDLIEARTCPWLAEER